MSDVASQQLATAVRRGVPWIIVGQVLSQVISLLTLAGLYRLLAPEVFGLFGMALPFVMLPRMLATLGLSAATVQRPQLSEEDRSGVFWLQVALGGGFTLLAAASAPLAVWWYGAPAVAPIIVALSGTVLIASISATHQALLERNLKLARVTLVRLIGQLLGASAALWAAWNGWQGGALVVQQFSELLALIVSTWVAHPWWPGRPRRLTQARTWLHFSGYYSSSMLLFFVTQNADKVLLGWWLGSTPGGQALVGAYTQAYNLMMRPVYLVTAPMTGLLLPALSRASSRHVFNELTTGTFRLAAVALAPCAVGLWVVGYDVMLLLGGPNWTDAGVLVAILAPAILAQGWINLCGSVLAARDRADLLCFLAVLLTLISLQAFAAGAWFGGEAWGTPRGPTLGVALGLIVATTVILFVPYIYVTLRAVEVSPGDVFKTLVRPLRSAVLMGLSVLLVRGQLPAEWPLAIRLIVLIATGVMVYTVLAWAEVKWVGERRRSSANVQ